MHSAFHLYEEATPELIAFLSKTVLGTNGAKYQHLDTKIRIAELENPLHLSLIRNEKIIGNITFCRRGKEWYVRYFAFDIIFQGKGKERKKDRNSLLKKEIAQFFQEKIDSGEVDCFYAYIDPSNSKSALFAESIGFSWTGTIHTQTFSRLYPKKQKNLVLIEDQTLINGLIEVHFSSEKFYHEQLARGKFYALYNSSEEIVAFAQAARYSWRIHRLPGKHGQLLTSIVPFIPVLRKFIRPHNHTFIGIDNVWSRKDSRSIIALLMEGILAEEKEKMIIWWTDERLKHYQKVKWGWTDKFLISNKINLVSFPKQSGKENTPIYTISKDLT